MANADNLLTTTLATAGMLEAFRFNTPFVQTIKSYSSDFGAPNGSRNVGSSINIPKPARYIPGGGRGVIDFAYSRKDTVEELVALTIDSSRNTDIDWDIKTQKMDLTSFTQQCRDQAMVGISEFVESDHLEEVSKASNVVLAGSSGVTFANITDALSILKENGAPPGDYTMLMGQRMNSSVLKGNYTLFNGDKSSDKSFIAGYQGGMYGGFDFMASELIPTHMNGAPNDGAFDATAGVTPLGDMNGATANGATQILVDGIAGADGTVTAGTKIEIAGVYKVNPITKKNLGVLKQFSVAADATIAAGAGTIVLTERMVDGTGTAGTGLVDVSLQNVSALPLTEAVVSFVGKASTLYRQGIAYCKQSFGCAFTELEKPSNAPSQVKTMDGMTIRTIEDFDYLTNINILRIHSVFGAFTPRPEWACAVWEEA